MHASEKSHSVKNPSQGIVRMFQNSVTQSNKESVALHPHLYSGLYHRASEIKALDKILYDLKLAAEEAKEQKYKNLPPILAAIKDTLNGKPQLSWWNLFTLSIGQALSTSKNEEENNIEENKYLAQISEILTGIIRNFRSPNSKLLLEIRLAALEIDSRVVEIDKIPQDVNDADETLDYISSEFYLLIKELERIKNNPPDQWNRNNLVIYECIKKATQLMRVLTKISETNPKTYQKLISLSLMQKLQSGIDFILSEFRIADDEASIDFWQAEQLDDFFKLFSYLPNNILALRPAELYMLLKQSELLFIENPNLDKKRPKIFSSQELFSYIIYYNEEFIKSNSHMRAVIKGVKEDRAIKQNPIAHFKQRFMEENDLHHIVSKIRLKTKDYEQQSSFKQPSAIQQEVLNRMILLANISQPKELDAVLKNFTELEKENRYFLSQEVILEQFIRWRKQGIY